MSIILLPQNQFHLKGKGFSYIFGYLKDYDILVLILACKRGDEQGVGIMQGVYHRIPHNYRRSNKEGEDKHYCTK